MAPTFPLSASMLPARERFRLEALVATPYAVIELLRTTGDVALGLTAGRALYLTCGASSAVLLLVAAVGAWRRRAWAPTVFLAAVAGELAQFLLGLQYSLVQVPDAPPIRVAVLTIGGLLLLGFVARDAWAARRSPVGAF